MHIQSQIIACVALLTAVTGCSGPPGQGQANFSAMDCPALSSASQQYMRGTTGIPVRCGAQARSPLNGQ